MSHKAIVYDQKSVDQKEFWPQSTHVAPVESDRTKPGKQNRVANVIRSYDFFMGKI